MPGQPECFPYSQTAAYQSRSDCMGSVLDCLFILRNATMSYIMTTYNCRLQENDNIELQHSQTMMPNAEIT